MFCITAGPPAAEMKLGSSQAEHSLIGIVGSCARMARIAAAARDTVLTPAGREIAQYERFRKDLAVAEASRQT